MTKWLTYDESVQDMAARGMTVREIALVLGTSPQSVVTIGKRLGVTFSARKPGRSMQPSEGNWPDLKERFIAECRRLRLPPQVTLAKEMGVTRQRAEHVLKFSQSPRRATQTVERFLERVRTVKPKPSPREIAASLREKRLKEAVAQRAEIDKIVRTFVEMTSHYGARYSAARDLGMSHPSVYSIASGKTRAGPIVAARLAAWVESHSS
jgi:hypothetical protein